MTVLTPPEPEFLLCPARQKMLEFELDRAFFIFD